MPFKFETIADAEIEFSDRKDNEKRDATKRVQPRAWDPIWLRRSVLFAFVALYLALAAAIILVDRIVARRNGLSMTVTVNHYYWTYGPTAILVIVVALWRRVQYCVMVNQPWQQLSQKDSPQTAETTVLLDYISPFQVNSCVAALRNRHFGVAASISVFALLKLVIVVSTMLFLPQNTLVHRDIQLPRQTSFGFKANWLHYIHNDPDNVEGGSDYWLRSDPVWNYKYLRSTYADAEVPKSLSVAFTNFSVPANIPGSSVTIVADMEVFQPNISCEAASADNVQNFLDGITLDLTVESPSCGPVHVHSDFPVQMNWNETLGVSSSNWFFVGRAKCMGHDNEDDDFNLDSTTPNTFRYFLTEVRLPYDIIKQEDSAEQEQTTVLCSVDYSLRQAKALVPAFNPAHIDSIDLVEDMGRHKERTLTGLSNLQLSETIFTSLRLAVRENPSRFPSEFGDVFSPATPPDKAAALRTQIEDLLTGVSHQVMRAWFLLPDNSTNTLSGSISYTDMRLHIRSTAVWTMVGLFVAMACLISLVVIPFTKQGVAPRRPAILASSAAVISRSPGMRKLLGTADHGAMRLSEIRANLAGYGFNMVQRRDRGLSIEAIATTRDANKPKKPTWVSEKWRSFRTTVGGRSAPRAKRPWMMFTSRRSVALLTLALPPASIVVLEVLYRKISEKRNNFITPTSESTPSSYAITYSSTATILLIATLFNSLDFSVATMAPFSRLAIGNARGRDTVLFNIVENLPPIAFYKAFQHRHFGAASSLVCSTLGSTLTIITSGLWFVNSSSVVSTPAIASMQAGWMVDFTATDIPGNETLERLWAREYHGIPYDLPLIWNDSLVIPTLKDTELAPSSAQGNSTFTISEFTLPIIQPTLTCSISPHDAMTAKQHYNGLSYSLIVGANLPDGCVSSSTGNAKIFTSIFLSFEPDLHPGKPYGKIQDIVSNVTATRGSVACPSLWFLSGVTGSDEKSRAVFCTQQLLYKDARITYNSTSHSLQTPGRVTNLELNPGTTRIIHSAQSEASTLSFNFARGYGRTFWSHFDLGFYGLSGDDLIVKANHMYQRYMTRLISLNYRTQNPSEDPNFIPIPGNGKAHGMVTVTGAQLEMSRVSKIVLQAVLGTMTLLGVLTYWLVNMRRVIPRNPYPIASSMAFFSASWLVNELAAKSDNRGGEGGEGGDDESIFEEISDRTFRLGWWWADTPEGTPTYTPEDTTDMATETDEGRESREISQAEGLSMGPSSDETLHNISENTTESTPEDTTEMRNETIDGSQGDPLLEGQRREQRSEDTPKDTIDGTTEIADRGSESRDESQAEELFWGQRFGIDIHVTLRHGDE